MGTPVPPGRTFPSLGSARLSSRKQGDEHESLGRGEELPSVRTLRDSRGAWDSCPERLGALC